jgi:hypothetical protein
MRDCQDLASSIASPVTNRAQTIPQAVVQVVWAAKAVRLPVRIGPTFRTF